MPQQPFALTQSELTAGSSSSAAGLSWLANPCQGGVIVDAEGWPRWRPEQRCINEAYISLRFHDPPSIDAIVQTLQDITLILPCPLLHFVIVVLLFLLLLTQTSHTH